MEKVYKHKKTGQIAYYKDGVFKQNNCSVEIGVEPSSEFWEEVRTPILTTEDNVDIFEGDEVTWLYRDELKIAGTRNANENMYTDLKYFSTRESAKEYILMNKPLLSLNDLLSVWGNNQDVDFYKESPMLQKFKNLAKTKLYE